MKTKNSKTKEDKSEYAIEVNDIDKSFWIPDEHIGSFKGYFLRPWKLFSKKGKRFDALSDVSFKIKKGEFVGIIGRNGSGKSTLLKLLAGIYATDKGEIKVNGKLVPFLELGVGFNPELSARENVYLNGTILGMSKKFLDKKFDEIIDFAEIREFVDTPVKNFSSGMMVRLAFAIAIQSDADIYLLDEVFGVGDIGFRKRSMAKIDGLIERGATILYVSHDLENITRYADKALYLENGKKKAEGEPHTLISKFKQDMSLISKESGDDLGDLSKQLTDGRGRITNVVFKNSKNEVTDNFDAGEPFIIEVSVEASSHIDNPVVYIGLRTTEYAWDKKLFEFNTDRTGKNRIKSLEKGDTVSVTFDVKNPLNPGEYSVYVHLGDPKYKGKGDGTVVASYRINRVINIAQREDDGDMPDWSGFIRADYDCKI